MPGRVAAPKKGTVPFFAMIEKRGQSPLFQAPLFYAPPVKRSVTIAGHETALTLEPVFWAALERAAQDKALPLNALIARIDAERIAAAPAPNLASAVRQWLFANASHYA
jgi:predicted DNA-binding ribbon-helix-helix protein